jgi:chemotaxis protein CheX
MFENQTIIDYVNAATGEVFTTMLGVEIQCMPSHVEEADLSVSDGVLAFVGMAGPWTGAGAVTCSAKLACQLCAYLLGTEAESVNEEVLDALGELTNMIIGGFKTLIERHTGVLGLSIPTVVYGHNFTSRSTGRNAWVVVPFQCGSEIMEVRVCLAPSKEPSAHRSSSAHPSVVLA